MWLSNRAPRTWLPTTPMGALTSTYGTSSRTPTVLVSPASGFPGVDPRFTVSLGSISQDGRFVGLHPISTVGAPGGAYVRDPADGDHDSREPCDRSGGNRSEFHGIISASAVAGRPVRSVLNQGDQPEPGGHGRVLGRLRPRSPDGDYHACQPGRWRRRSQGQREHLRHRGRLGRWARGVRFTRVKPESWRPLPRR